MQLRAGTIRVGVVAAVVLVLLGAASATPWGVTLSLPDIDPDSVFKPLTAYSIMRLGKVKLLPYFRPGDPAMGDAVRGVES